MYNQEEYIASLFMDKKVFENPKLILDLKQLFKVKMNLFFKYIKSLNTEE